MSDWKQTLTVIGILLVGFGFVGNELGSLRADMRENHAALQGAIDALRDDLAELSVNVGRIEVRLEHVEQSQGIISAPAAE